MKRKPHTALRFCVIFTFHYLSGRWASSETREISFQHTVFEIGFQIAWNGFTAVLPDRRKCQDHAVGAANRGRRNRQNMGDSRKLSGIILFPLRSVPRNFLAWKSAFSNSGSGYAVEVRSLRPPRRRSLSSVGGRQDVS